MSEGDKFQGNVNEGGGNQAGGDQLIGDKIQTSSTHHHYNNASEEHKSRLAHLPTVTVCVLTVFLTITWIVTNLMNQSASTSNDSTTQVEMSSNQHRPSTLVTDTNTQASPPETSKEQHSDPQDVHELITELLHYIDHSNESNEWLKGLKDRDAFSADNDIYNLKGVKKILNSREYSLNKVHISTDTKDLISKINNKLP